MIAVNLTSTFAACHAVLPHMLARGWGRIVNIASTAGLKGYAYTAAYSAAKHGVIGLTRALAIELAQTGVTVNAVCPGFTDTDLVRRASQTIAQQTGRSEADARAALDALQSARTAGRARGSCRSRRVPVPRCSLGNDRPVDSCGRWGGDMTDAPHSAACRLAAAVRLQQWHGRYGTGDSILPARSAGTRRRSASPKAWPHRSSRHCATSSTLLAEAGAEATDIVRLTWFVTDMEQYRREAKAIGQGYRRVMGRHFPTMSVIGVSCLVERDALVEIEATAVVRTMADPSPFDSFARDNLPPREQWPDLLLEGSALSRIN